ncbi:FAD-dependent oxidoreductase [Microbispora sp. H10949]|uniref:FAD-dependent oxidoreductase n=1 Tax=Microbispora sp. H10949 TaxID=2729111 RepID=UPI0016000760|nr:FAD-dependent oxidoreductase [Microbispora sp. H10949]
MQAGARVAVVGGGIFGVTSALHLDRAGYDVVLFERNSDLLLGASSTNQRRLHRGYHYPRSIDTARSVLDGVGSFATEFPESVVSSCRRYVAIAREKSLVDAETFLGFLDHMGLEYYEQYPPFLRRESVEISLRVEESGIDVERLRGLCWRKLRRSLVEVRLRAPVELSDLEDFDHVVLATYAALNHIETTIPGRAMQYKFEVCEKPVVKLPPEYRDTSLIILDGPFMCIDPIAGTDTFLFGNVAHAIHASTVGLLPLVPEPLIGLVDNGLRRNPSPTNFPLFVAGASEFLVGIEEADHMGSLFTIRAVLPHVEDTDARPTLVHRINERVTSVFSGKISTCVDAAREVVRIVGDPTAASRPL